LLPHRSCIVCSLPRSGSWLLAEALDNTGVVGVPEEYFRPDYQEPFLQLWNKPKTTRYRDFLKEVVKAGTTPNGVFSAKVHWTEFSLLIRCLRRLPGYENWKAPELISAFFPNPKYVYLTRQDKMRQAISYYRAIRLDVWWELDEAGTDLSDSWAEKPDLQEIARLEELLVRLDRRWREYFRNANIDPLVLTYEGLVSDYDATVMQVIRFMDVPAPGGMTLPAPRLRKQATGSSEECVHRYVTFKRSTQPPVPELYGLLS
jgi:LPS sulfotransferase NodH